MACHLPMHFLLMITFDLYRYIYLKDLSLSSIGIYAVLCVKQRATGKLMYNTGRSAQCSVIS